jgi:hypothetical protein
LGAQNQFGYKRRKSSIVQLDGQPICDNNDDFNSGQNGENRQPLTTIELKKKQRMTHGR